MHKGILHIIFITFFSCLNAYACSEDMKNFVLECKSQDRYQNLALEYKKYSININDLKGFKIPRAVGKSVYFSNKNDFLNHTDTTLYKNKQWQAWNNGQKYISAMSLSSIELNDVLKLHKTLFPKSLLDLTSESGKLRTNNPVTNPKIVFNCKDNFLEDKVLDLLSDYDLKNSEGYPLLTLENITSCNESNHSSADLFYFKGASIKFEMNRWLTDFNDMLSRFETQNAPAELSPYFYLADMSRWFLALQPFSSGNAEVIQALMDYATTRLELPALTTIELDSSPFTTVSENRNNTLDKLKENLTFLEGCLFETKTKPISLECSVLK